VDASVAVQWFANEPGSAVAAGLLEQDTSLCAPDLMPIEAVNAWWKKVQLGEMQADDLDQALIGLRSLGLDFVPALSLLARAARLAVDIGHPVYDCLYLTLAGDRQARLASADRPLRRAAARLGIKLWTG
jgi:predicted nucleic acid-binding protein